ncbi:uncharacterized protein LOC131956219 [Physella acuta]|uniref:uncharacterized protein LOC131956219 n=1 Tax=Physella acuta TaxID=109671 RepID=UPI0027DE70C5|nr:uncharacterized protein LOC131956219 [Physella acuta]
MTMTNCVLIVAVTVLLFGLVSCQGNGSTAIPTAETVYMKVSLKQQLRNVTNLLKTSCDGKCESVANGVYSADTFEGACLLLGGLDNCLDVLCTASEKGSYEQLLATSHDICGACRAIFVSLSTLVLLVLTTLVLVKGDTGLEYNTIIIIIIPSGVARSGVTRCGT